MCVRDSAAKQELRDRTCKLPKYVHDTEVPLLKSKTCANEESEKFHYNSDLGVCESFTYAGCWGTDNVFDSDLACQSVCEGKL